MKHLISLITFIIGFISTMYSQNYTSYFTGNSNDVITFPSGGVCLMGGATEDDNAMTWFLQQANGGDILVLRASGSNGYNNYMYSGLEVNINSVETIVFNDSSASNEPYIHQRIEKAEAIWIAGGDQWDYVSYWRDSPIDSLINDALTNRNIVIGGTSAGMAIQGGFYFSAENGTVTSTTALSDPFDSRVTIGHTPFISNQYLSDVITDTHYDDPDRKGRHVVFLSRILVDYGIVAKGIACDEYTAICIDSDGIARVYGSYPTYDDNAYFIQPNCELLSNTPENCSLGTPLDWNLGNSAMKAYVVKGTSNGLNTFDLNNWETGTGGSWENWYVDNGVLNEQTANQPNCQTLSLTQIDDNELFKIYPNPARDIVSITFNLAGSYPMSIKIINGLGQEVERIILTNSNEVHIKTSHIPIGVYFIKLTNSDNSTFVKKLMIK